MLSGVLSAIIYKNEGLQMAQNNDNSLSVKTFHSISSQMETPYCLTASIIGHVLTYQKSTRIKKGVYKQHHKQYYRIRTVHL